MAGRFPHELQRHCRNRFWSGGAKQEGFEKVDMRIETESTELRENRDHPHGHRINTDTERTELCGAASQLRDHIIRHRRARNPRRRVSRTCRRGERSTAKTTWACLAMQSQKIAGLFAYV